ncbi:MAG TPA: restriction endonuclease [Aestuariivirga sp.]
MKSEDYAGLMRPWYGTESSFAREMNSEPQCEVEALEEFEFSPLPRSEIEYKNSQRRCLVALDLLHASHERELAAALLGRIHCLTHSCFEGLILDVVRAAGFASTRADMAHKVGRSGDGGIDGVIDLDDFGLDAIYLQAKRLRPGGVVGAGAVRDFLGSLETRRANKGVFVTTGQFSLPAMMVVKSVTRRITLINGQRLVELMIRHGIGLKKVKSFDFQEVDSHWFQQAEEGVRSA